MFRSDDDVIRVEVVNSLAHVIFPPCDGSIVPASVDPVEMRAIMHGLWNSPCDKHVSLVLPRHRRSQSMKVLENIAQIKDWQYLDTVQIVYEKTIQSNASSFVRNSESGFLFFKGDFPQIDKTQWFNPDYSNATTTWGVSPQPEEPIRNTAYQRFSWELMLLMVTLCHPLHYGRFVYALDANDDNILQFAAYHQIPLQLYSQTVGEAGAIIEKYQEIKSKLNTRAINARRKRKLMREENSLTEDDFINNDEEVEQK
jgi:hypothetical protein